MQESVYYTDLRWPEIQACAESGAIILLPVGQVEEHGPHLPVGTDCHISTAVAEAVAKEASREFPVLVLPTLWTGYSGRDLFNWPGTLSLPPEVMIAVLENICVSLNRSGFKKVVVLNSHGHHIGIARVAARKVADRCDSVVVLTDTWKMGADAVAEVRQSGPGGCCHAGEYETSLALYFKKRVDMSAAKDEKVVSHSEFVNADMFGPGSKVFWSTWRYQKSETGTYGCPTCATAEKGKIIFDHTVAAYISLLRELHAEQ